MIGCADKLAQSNSGIGLEGNAIPATKRKTISAIRAVKTRRKRLNKFRAVPSVVFGILFDSKKEAERYVVLVSMESAGLIKNLRRQVSYEIAPACRLYGKMSRARRYTADFVYERDGKTIVEDVKGRRTEAYILRRHLMRTVHGIEILET